MSKAIKKSLKKIFTGINILKKYHPEKEFTIDGRLVGDIGEILAHKKYQIQLFDKLEKDYDAETPDGQKVQIKATFKDSLTLKNKNGYYIGLKIDVNGNPTEIYNGPAKYIYQAFEDRKGIGKVLLSFPIKKLKEISDKIPVEEKILKKNMTLQ